MNIFFLETRIIPERWKTNPRAPTLEAERHYPPQQYHRPDHYIVEADVIPSIEAVWGYLMRRSAYIYNDKPFDMCFTIYVLDALSSAVVTRRVK